MAALRSQTTGDETGNASGVTLVAGDLVVVTLRERDGSTMAVSDSINGSYTLAVNAPLTVGRCGIYYFRNSGAGTATFTVTGGTVRDYVVSVWSGMQTGVGTFDTSGSVTSAAGTSHAHAGSNITPSASAVVITAWAGTGDHGGVTPHTGFFILNASATGGGVARQYYAYKLAHTGAINPTHTSVNSITTDGAVAAFLESGGGGGSTAVPVFVHHRRQQGFA